MTNLQPELTGETVATLIAAPITVAIFAAFGSVLFVLWRCLRAEALTDVDADIAHIACGSWILCAVALVLTVVGTWWGMYPWKADYHHWTPTDGVVDTVDSRLVATGDKAMEDKYTVKFVGSDQQYGVLDTRAAGLRPGDHLTITCVRRWQWSGTHGYDCNFVSMERGQ